MRMKMSATDPGAPMQLQRRRARRTACVLAAVAVAIYAAFILSGVLAH